MIKFLFLVILIGLAVWGGFELHQSSGYLTIVFRQWQVETNVLTAFTLVLLTFIILYIIIRFIIRSAQWPKQLRQWKKSHRQRRAEKFNQLAICALIEEKWQLAEEYFNKASQQLSEPLMSYMGAAIGAHFQNHFNNRDDYLHRAFTNFPEAEIPLSLLKAKLQIKSGQLIEAHTTLNKLFAVAPRDPVVQRLLSSLDNS